MNKHEATLIAAAANQLRPDWPVRQLMTLLGHASLRDRPRRDVAVALAWVACEPATANPYRVLEAGPWWKAAGVEGSAHIREPWDPGGSCSVCSLPEHRCRATWADDHDYTSAARHADDVKAAGFDVAAVRAALAGEVQPTRERPEPERPVRTNPHAAAARAALNRGEDS